jgi:hypothetical protein
LREEIPSFGFSEAGIVNLQTFEYILQARRCRSGWTHRETETVGLINVVIRILPENDDLDAVEGGML